MNIRINKGYLENRYALKIKDFNGLGRIVSNRNLIQKKKSSLILSVYLFVGYQFKKYMQIF